VETLAIFTKLTYAAKEIASLFKDPEFLFSKIPKKLIYSKVSADDIEMIKS
jgi:hypothetical protein